MDFYSGLFCMIPAPVSHILRGRHQLVLKAFQRVRCLHLRGNILAEHFSAIRIIDLLQFPRRSIEEGAFMHCRKLSKLTLGNRVATIENNAFYGCGSLESVTFPDSVVSIGEEAFNFCKSLTSVTFGRGIKNVADYAFYMCPHLKHVEIPVHIPMLSENVHKPAHENVSELFQNP